jgi:hypothetical protein
MPGSFEVTSTETVATTAAPHQLERNVPFRMLRGSAVISPHSLPGIFAGQETLAPSVPGRTSDAEGPAVR